MRGQWYLATTETRQAAERAAGELKRRNVKSQPESQRGKQPREQEIRDVNVHAADQRSDVPQASPGLERGADYTRELAAKLKRAVAARAILARRQADEEAAQIQRLKENQYQRDRKKEAAKEHSEALQR